MANYNMRAYNTNLLSMVHWVSQGQPDFTGASSGYPTPDISEAVVTLVVVVGSVPGEAWAEWPYPPMTPLPNAQPVVLMGVAETSIDLTGANMVLYTPAPPSPAGLYQPSFPAQVQVVMGALAYGGIAEDTVVTLNRVSVSQTVAVYTEDGTLTPNTSTNRLKLSMRATTNETTGTATKNQWTAAFYSVTTFATTTSDGYGGYTTSTTTNWAGTNSITNSPLTATDVLYTFKELYSDNVQFGSGWGTVIKSLIGL